MITKHIFSITEFAKFARTTRDTLVHYESYGLLVPERGENNYRYYSHSQLATINLIRTCQALGMSLSEVKDLIAHRTPIQMNELLKCKINDTGSHEAIIDKDTFAAVQAEIERRAAIHAPKAPSPSKPYPFAGLVQCGKCGALYRRKLGNAGSKYSKPVLICTTFDQRGKAECDSQQIPEDILLEKAEEFGGLAGISKIRVPEHNLLILIYKDGSVIDVPWQHRSRRESWTPEMREAARQKMLARNKGRHPNE